MKLRPVIASYSGETSSHIEHYLTENVLGIIADITRTPAKTGEIPGDVLAELIEMHVLREYNGQIGLNTSVFLEQDIEGILDTVTPLAEELCRQVLASKTGFRGASPETVHFLGGIIGLLQGMGLALEEKYAGATWKSYTGKYAKSKVDFDEECAIYDSIGPDYLNKSVIQGEQYTAVFIGPAGNAFKTFTYAINSSEAGRRFRNNLNRFLVDAYAMLIRGEIQNEPLQLSAEMANIRKQGKWRTAVITNSTFREYEDAIKTLKELATTYYIEKLGILETLLRSTTAGRQGVPPENMLLNLSRYMRKITARGLYSRGFFTDTIPEEGTLTVFYENNVELIRRLLI